MLATKVAHSRNLEVERDSLHAVLLDLKSSRSKIEEELARSQSKGCKLHWASTGLNTNKYLLNSTRSQIYQVCLNVQNMHAQHKISQKCNLNVQPNFETNANKPKKQPKYAANANKPKYATNARRRAGGQNQCRWAGGRADFGAREF